MFTFTHTILANTQSVGVKFSYKQPYASRHDSGIETTAAFKISNKNLQKVYEVEQM